MDQTFLRCQRTIGHDVKTLLNPCISNSKALY